MTGLTTPSGDTAPLDIAVIGRGNLGGGLADLWERAGHAVTRLGRGGGDVAQADVVVIAVPGDAVADALAGLEGLAGKTVIDATNRYGVEPPAGFASNAEYSKSVAKGPAAKAFNTNFASLFGRIAEARAAPSSMWCGDDEAREVVERLNRDAGYEPVRLGGLDQASLQEGAALDVVMAILQGGLGEYVYRAAPVEEL